jgi:predicted molibdopterin-dependent oxidoreductase YjgC
MAQLRLTIDGQAVAAEEGTTVLEAARTAGIDIPTLCYHPDLPPNVACRVCVVEVKGWPRLQASCALPVSEGMVVQTNTPKVRRVRRLMIELMLSEHPRDCLTCEQAGTCELQDLAYAYSVKEARFAGRIQRYDLVDENPFIVRDYDKCIGCWRCTAACAEVQGRFAIGKGYRGFETHPVAGFDVVYEQSNCEFCGQCVAYCPTGALSERSAVGAGRTWEVTKVTTTCPYCGVGCNFDLNVRDGRIVRVTSAPDAPVNGMALCVKGRFGWDFVHHPDRLRRPLVRAKWLDAELVRERLQGGAWEVLPRPGESDETAITPETMVETDWETALDLVAARFDGIKREHGGDAFAVLASAKCTNEENYVIQKFSRAVLGTNSVDHCARL